MCKKHTRFLQSFLALKKTRPICIATLAVSVCMLMCACTNNVGSMIEDYNGHFVVGTGEPDYTVDKISASQMLGEKYAVSYYTTLCLLAPYGGVGYSWTAEVAENAESNELEKGTVLKLASTQALTLYLRGSSIERWGAYKLTLSVTTVSGEIMQDTAWLYVY